MPILGVNAVTRWQYVTAGILALLILLGLAYCGGVRKGAEDVRLSDSRKAITRQADTIKAVTHRSDSARTVSDSVVRTRIVHRDRVRVVRDSVFVRDTVFVSKEVATLITSSDSTIAAQGRSLALQDTLIVTLRRGITLRDERIGLLEKAKRPRFGYRAGVVTGLVIAGAVIVAVR
ncbi:MAG TPA: hypothetical protein VNJ04_02525 [Gemmatimonadaceae bacterium]|nr:hypothetical protein [Gemmatimonadaceae bacterium]